jgi:hypothetical protein
VLVALVLVALVLPELELLDAVEPVAAVELAVVVPLSAGPPP